MQKDCYMQSNRAFCLLDPVSSYLLKASAWKEAMIVDWTYVVFILKIAMIIVNHIFYHALPFVVLMHELSLVLNVNSVMTDLTWETFLFKQKFLSWVLILTHF